MGAIRSIEEYLREISKLSKDKKFAFRGEVCEYKSYCKPNLFRLDNYKHDKNIEVKILDKYSSKFGDPEREYLYKAIDLQHGGFPSRLLDVSFNSLIALHFAVTPHFTIKENEFDAFEGNLGSNGVVYIINCEGLISPTSYKASELFQNIIFRNKILPIDSYSHFILDNLALNERIKVQNGGFILFGGEEFKDIEYLIENKIIVDKEYKTQIREDLRRYFGIDNGYVYPESDHSVNKFLNDVKYYGSYTLDSSKINNIRYLINKRFSFLEQKLVDDLMKLHEKDIIYRNELNIKISGLKILKSSSQKNDFQKSYLLFLGKRSNSKKLRDEFQKNNIDQFERNLIRSYRSILYDIVDQILDFRLDFEISLSEMKGYINFDLKELNSINNEFYSLNEDFTKSIIEKFKALKELSIDLSVLDFDFDFAKKFLRGVLWRKSKMKLRID